MSPARRVVVTGASSGIGADTVRVLREQGFEVAAVARRADRLEALAAETGAVAYAADLTDQAQVDRLAADLLADGPVHALVNNAGGAFGLEPLEQASEDHWQRMYDINVLGTMRITRALLPHMRESGGGDFVFVTSVAAYSTYPGGAGYIAAKHAERAMSRTLRLELIAEPFRVIEIAPGAVQTEEFSLNRFGGDVERAAKVYEGFDPLQAIDIAEAIVWALSRPPYVNIDSMIIRPRAQFEAGSPHTKRH